MYTIGQQAHSYTSQPILPTPPSFPPPSPPFFFSFSFLKVQIYLRSSYKTLEDEKSCSQARQRLVQLMHYKLYLS